MLPACATPRCQAQTVRGKDQRTFGTIPWWLFLAASVTAYQSHHVCTTKRAEKEKYVLLTLDKKTSRVLQWPKMEIIRLDENTARQKGKMQSMCTKCWGCLSKDGGQRCPLSLSLTLSLLRMEMCLSSCIKSPCHFCWVLCEVVHMCGV